jgi:hypothetical protein
MNNKQVDSIIKQTGKSLTPFHEVKPLKPKRRRAKSPKYDLSEKAFAKQIDEIIAGNKKKR